MKRVIKIATITIFLLSMLNSTVFGASACWRFMHNDHDTLLLGEIIEIIAMDDDVEIVIQAESFIVSANSLHENAAMRQLRPQIARVINFHSPDRFHIGDYVIASLNREGDRFVVAWGMFEVDSLDYRTLTVGPAESSDRTWMEFTTFVNRGGHGGQVIAAGTETCTTILHLHPRWFVFILIWLMAIIFSASLFVFIKKWKKSRLWYIWYVIPIAMIVFSLYVLLTHDCPGYRWL